MLNKYRAGPRVAAVAIRRFTFSDHRLVNAPATSTHHSAFIIPHCI
jgi:hypothetical protein